jgi:hypothetical protein
MQINDNWIWRTRNIKAHVESQRIKMKDIAGTDRSWITIDSRNLLWLPSDYRPSSSAVAGTTIAVGSVTGRITVLQIHSNVPHPKMPHEDFSPLNPTFNIFTKNTVITLKLCRVLKFIQMSQYTETKVQQALDDMANGKSIRQTASGYDVPKSTLQNRIRGVQPRDIAFSDHQRLSPTQRKSSG